MSNNDVADIEATLKNIGVTATPAAIKEKLAILAKFRVPANEAKRNIVTDFARKAGVDPKLAYKGNAVPVKIADIKEDGKWINLKAKVVSLWDNEHDTITQTGLIGDETGVIKFTLWASSKLPPMEVGKAYDI